MKLTFQSTDLDITVTTDKDEVIYSYQAKDIKSSVQHCRWPASTDRVDADRIPRS